MKPPAETESRPLARLRNEVDALADSPLVPKGPNMMNKSQAIAAFIATLCLSTVAHADNPIVQTMFTADPAPLVHDGVFYMYTGHDEDGAGWFDMREWRVYSTTDMANWTDLGSPMNLKTFSWGKVDAWAGQCVFRDGKFYFYVPIRLSGDNFGIGVGVSDKPEGPFTDAIGKPLLTGNSYIDPTVFVDNDGQAYMYFGNGHLWWVKINQDMISTSGNVTEVSLTKDAFDASYLEGPWLHRRGNLYYLLWSSQAQPAAGVTPSRNMENIRYSTSTSPTGPWKYGGMIMPSEGASWTNHSGTVDYEGNSYLAYHNSALPGGGDGQRSVCVEQFSYGADGSIPKFTMSKTGPQQLGTLNPFQTVQAETIAFSAGLKTEKCNDAGGGLDVTNIHNDDYIKVKGLNFGSGASSLDVRVASATAGGSIELHLDSLTGPLIGSCTIQGTGGAQTWTTKTCSITGASGTRDLFFKFVGSGTGPLFNFNWWKFGGPGADNGNADGGAGTGGAGGSGTGTGGAGGTATGGASGGAVTGGTSVSGGQGASATGGTASTGGKTGGSVAPTAGTGGSGTGGTSSSGGATASSAGGRSGGSTGGSSGGGRGSGGCSVILGSTTGDRAIVPGLLLVALGMLRARRCNRHNNDRQ
jgi:hypothetical protein